MSTTQRKRRSPRSSRSLRILFTCAGRRVELIETFRDAARRSRIALTVITTDVSILAPAMHVGDRAHVVPPLRSRRYAAALRDIVARERVDLLIPLIDPDLPHIARLRDELATLGCRALISSRAVVRICADKRRTHAFLCKHDIDTPDTWPLDEVLARRRHNFPYFLKPNAGSAGLGGYKIDDLDALRFFGGRVAVPIVQEFVPGPEMTLDIYAGFDGEPRCIVPRQRLEVRDGEVSKSRIVKDPAVIETGRRVVAALHDCVGVVTLQCIVAPRGRVRVIEINPRFGGGVPLAIKAGADFPRWILAEHRGQAPRIDPDAYTDGLEMLRHDRAMYTTATSTRRSSKR